MTVLIENLRIVQAGLRYMLETELPDEKVLIYNSVEHLQESSLTVVPRLVLVSLMKDLHGEGPKHIAAVGKAFPQSSIVGYGQDLVPDIIRVYYMAGVDGYFSLMGDDFTECIKTVLDGKTYFNHAMVSSFILHLQARDHEFQGPILTGKQFKIACLLARGTSVAEIASLSGVKSAAISAARTRIFNKLSIRTIRELQIKINVFPVR